MLPTFPSSKPVPLKPRARYAAVKYGRDAVRMQTFKLFVSSPGDVMVERRRVDNVVS
jgi:hypothetical protein